MTENIKELLELAARACGIEVPEDGPWGGVSEVWGVHEFNGDGSNFTRRWSPHLDDGDGARMEAELVIKFDWFNTFIKAYGPTKGEGPWQLSTFVNATEHLSDHAGNKQAARRMASLRVAALIGERM
jgi:hypothetical protein